MESSPAKSLLPLVAPKLTHLTVNGLYGSRVQSLRFFPDVTVVYGRNGVGKTTLLHIIANALSGSFDRFVHLPFADIELVFDDHVLMQLKRSIDVHADIVKVDVSINGESIAQSQALLTDAGQISSSRAAVRTRRTPSEQLELDFAESLRTSRDKLDTLVLGHQVAYFPAFRNMIEAWLNASDDVTTSRTRTSSAPLSSLNRMRSRHASTITHMARQVFGEFVPVVNYVGASEIDAELVSSMRDAALRVGADTQSQLSAAFLDIFTVLLSNDPAPKRAQHLSSLQSETL